ncbi:MAG: IPT/TIG domain-containing protein, partial [Candidatus Nomurabacteria bacterium]|nr:IPT/TIG domain-containing protein [Candidatus Nomurabacteria bacterium]
MVWFSWVSPAVEALTVSGISRNSGSVDGGESVVVTGTDFITYTTGGTTIENKTSGSGTYTVPSDTISMKIEVWGAGGNGGDGVSFQNNNTYFYFPGAGGGGGGYTTRTFTNPTANTTVSYEVGAGGGGTSKATYSTYTSLIAYGGSNGSNALSGSYSSNSSTGFASWNFSGGGGGAASGGGTTSDNKQGADGGSAVGSNIYCVQSISSGAGGASANGGSGGSAVSGPLGRTVSSGSPCGGGISDTNVSGNVGLVIGGGGSGGLGGINNPQDNADGGIGARGQVRISTTRSDYRNPDPVVKFGTVTATCTVNSNTQMTCSAPAGTGTVAVTVGGVAAGNYTYYVAPTVTGVTTATGAGVTKTYTVKSNGQWPNATIGTNRTTRTVAIAGTGFVDVSAVVVGGVACSSYTVNSASSITCTLPTTVRSGAFLVQVTTPGGTSASSGELGVVGIVYVPAPVVSYVAVPTDGTVKINGERKDNLSGTTWTPNVSTRASVYGVYDDIDRFITFHDNDYIKLTMGGQTCEVSAWGSQEILCDMPNWGSAGNKAIQVSNAYGTSNTDVYVTAVAGPTITGVTPGTGVLTTGGTVLTITGTGFQTSFTVTVGGVECA